MTNETLQARVNFQSQKRIDTLKKRTRRCVCKYCGGHLKLKRIIFSDFEDAGLKSFAASATASNTAWSRRFTKAPDFLCKTAALIAIQTWMTMPRPDR